MSTRIIVTVLVCLAAIGLLASKCLIVVPEYEQVVLTEFGEPVGGLRTDPGLYFLWPWYEVHRFSKRILRWDGDRAQVPTKDKRFIWIDATARWRIVDPLKFFKSVRNFEGAQTRIDDVIESSLRLTISDNNLIEAVRPDTRVVDLPGVGTQSDADFVAHSGREKLQREIVERASILTRREFGIDLVDVRIKRINYIEAVQANVFGRMIAERQKVAEQYRSEGAGRSAEIRGTMEKKLNEIRSGAWRTAREIQGDADATAARIYADAYNQDPEFYAFQQTLETLLKTFAAGGDSQRTHLVLGTDSELLSYLKSAAPGHKATTGSGR